MKTMATEEKKIRVAWYKHNDNVLGTSYHLETYQTNRSGGVYITLTGMSNIVSVRLEDKKKRSKLKWEWSVLIMVDDHDQAFHARGKASKAEDARGQAVKYLVGLTSLFDSSIKYEVDETVYNKRWH